MQDKLLHFKTKAQQAFNKRRYEEALQLLSYAHAFVDSRNTKELLQIKALSAICDMALEHEDEARALFEYYKVIRKKNRQGTEEAILGMIEHFDMNLYAISLAISHFQDLEVDKNDGILYEDFTELSKKIGFKEAFVDLMFSSKIIFTDKNDFLFFIKDLVKHGFKEIAINYFENAGNMLFYDKDFMNLYQKILQNP